MGLNLKLKSIFISTSSCCNKVIDILKALQYSAFAVVLQWSLISHFDFAIGTVWKLTFKR